MAQTNSRNDAAAGTGASASTLASQAMEFANVVYEKLSECIGSTDTLLPMVAMGAAAATVAGFTLYALSRYFDPDPFLFNNGKMGKLEAQSPYLNKKDC